MPHSSGGGSHHGGSHHSSHHRSGHSGGSNRSRISSTPYAGARRFRYRHRGGYRYFYTTRQPGKIFQPARLLIGLFYTPFIFAGVFTIKSAFENMNQSYSREVVIIDSANVLEDETKLRNSLNAFSEKTEITPAVITVNHDEWQNNYSSLEDYAYSRYLAEFPDEMHWLIVYSEPSTAQESAQNEADVDWCWEGMQGDDTDPVLTTYVTGQFNQTLQTALEQGTEPVSDSIASAFDVATSISNKMVRKPDWEMFGGGAFMLGFVCFHAFFMLGLHEWKYRHAELDPEDPGNVPDNRADPMLMGAQQMQSQPQFGTQVQQQFGTQQQFGAQVQQQFGTQQQFGAQVQQQFGTQQQFGAQVQQQFGTQQQFGAQVQQPFGMQQPASQSAEMPDLFTEPPQTDNNPFAMPQFDAQQRQFDLQQEQFNAQQRQFDMHQQQFNMPPLQPTPTVSNDPGFSQTNTQPAMKTCPYCGMQYFQGIRYCPGCGVDVSNM